MSLRSHLSFFLWSCWTFVLVVSSSTTTSAAAVEHHSGHGGNLTAVCNQLMAQCSEFKKSKIVGIPKTAEDVQTYCDEYNSRISCFRKYADTCLTKASRERLFESIYGANLGFMFLCRDTGFRADYLKHNDCFAKVETHYDDCSRTFINGMKKIPPNQLENRQTMCCVRNRFIKCVSTIANHHCNPRAGNFLQRLAKTLVEQVEQGPDSKPQTIKCDGVDVSHCSSADSLKPFFVPLLIALAGAQTLMSLVFHSRVIAFRKNSILSKFNRKHAYS